MSRLATILPAEFTEAQQTLYNNITGGKRSSQSAVNSFVNEEGGLRGPFNVMLYSPILGDAYQRLGSAIRFEGALPPELRELAILTVGAKWQAEYEWWAHEKIARDMGLDPVVIAGIKAGKLPKSASLEEQTVYDFACELMAQHTVSDVRYQGAVASLGESGVAELVIILGYYTLISMTLNVFEVPLPAGEVRPF